MPRVRRCDLAERVAALKPERPAAVAATRNAGQEHPLGFSAGREFEFVLCALHWTATIRDLPFV